MNRLIQFAAKHALALISIIIAFSLLALAQLGQLRIEVSVDGLIGKNDPVRIAHRQLLAEFGNEQSLAIIAIDPQLIRAEKLQTLKTLEQQLKTLPFIERLDSLYSIDEVQTSPDGEVVFKPYFDTLPKDPEALLSRTQHNPFVNHQLISEDGTTLALNLVLADDYAEHNSHADIVQAINAILATYQPQFEHLFALGRIYELDGLSRLIVNDQSQLLPLALLALLLVLFVSLRRWSGVLLPFLTASLSVLWTLGLMAYLGISINVMTSIIPALLIVIGSTEDIHLLSSWYRARDAGENKQQANFKSRKYRIFQIQCRVLIVHDTI